MKLVKFLPLFLLCLFASCNNNPESVEKWEYVPIVEVLEPECEIFPNQNGIPVLGDKLPSPSYVINSTDDFPNGDVFGMDKLKSADIDFDNYTLLVVYALYPDKLVDAKPNLNKLISEDKYRLITGFVIDSADNVDTWSLYMSAVVVDKIPPGAEVEFWNSFQ